MIGYVQGKLIESSVGEVIIDVNGVGYELKVPISTYSQLKGSGKNVTLFVHTHLRENALELYGFLTHEEKKLFRIFLTVTGVGPKLALSLLSGMPLDKLKTVLARGQIDILATIPGIGKKKAERLLIELKGKLKILDISSSQSAPHANDAMSALVNLGYKDQNVLDAMNKLELHDLSTEDIIRGVLREFSKGL